MSIRVRRVLEMVLRVLGFLRANPIADPRWQNARGRLEGGARKLQDLALQERTGHVTADAAAVTKEDIRSRLHDLFNLLAQTAALANGQDPTLPVRLSLPKLHSSQQVYLNSGRVVLGQAAEHQALLAPFGLTPDLLTELGATLDAYEQAIGIKYSGTSTHVGANAEMRALASDCIRLVGVLDAIHRPLFRYDAAKRAAWKSARTVVRTLPKTDIEPVDPTQPAAPPSDSAHPVA